MRHSEFWSVMDDVFGPVYARSLASDLVIGGLDGRTAQQALDGGEPPRAVWEAVCEATGQDEAVRYLHRQDPQGRRPGRSRPRG
ncbi:DUF3046 domain-containing protein [Serinibacter salmoneus]|uniref:DUF3046 family protein n=1 Tax=Serinibacter salmoneus TaxID=556530 RepID=A0A2A9D086_9MICO|nr:DUF3046 domain-containing protein [Serinibacter salmoneus]PFG19352.1 Protein of unknown function (DUF3046) [Serinibacter salmoneus]